MSNLNLTQIILKNINYDYEYCKKVLPFIKDDYFGDKTEKLIFNEINKFVIKYGAVPTYEALAIQVSENAISDSELSDGIELITIFRDSKDDVVDLDWLVEKTEGFCQERAIYNAVLDAISILDDKHKSLSKGAIPGLLSDALSVSFDKSVGHSYFDDSESRYVYYHKVENRIPFASEYFNLITNNGLPKKTLNVILSPPHGGKSLVMCDFASNFQLSGKNVLYITCEMAEEEIAKRIDANLLNISMDELLLLDKSSFDKKVSRVKEKTVGRLYVKEYPTASAGVDHFRSLLNELRLKRSFVPDIVFIDYLNICISSRMKMSSSINSYTYIKAIGEELRGLAQEYNIPVVTATQTTRGAATSTDVDMTDISESFGIAAIADFVVAIINTDELRAMGQIMIKQIKNRYRDFNRNKRFVIGVDFSKMKLHDLEPSAQQNIIDSGNEAAVINDVYTKTFNTKKTFEGFKI